MRNEKIFRSEIVVTKRSEDYHVCPRNQPGRWACGDSIDSAIGNWFRTHQADLGFKIIFEM